ncbi:MAG: glycosyltransferase [Bacteroidales bacterium]
MKVLFLTYDGLTDPLGQSQILPYLTGLTLKGHNITILSLEKEANLKKNLSLIQDICSKYHISWYYLSFPENHNRFSQFKTNRKFNIKALEISREINCDLIHCRSYPASLAGRYIQKKTSVPWVFDIRGFWIDERKEGKIWNTKNLFVKLIISWLRLKERKLYSHASAIVSLTHKGKAIIENKFIRPGKTPVISVIPCCADYSVFKPLENDKRNEVRSNLGISQSTYLLSYLGSLGTWYMLDEMLDFFSTLLIHKPDSCFLFITGEPPYLIKKLAGEKGIPEGKLLFRSSPRDQIPALLSASDCGIAYIRPVFSKLASSPVKWAETLACGTPVIVNTKVGDIESLQKQIEGLIVTGSFTAAGYQDTLQQLVRAENLSKEKIRNGSKVIYDLQTGIDHYQRVYQQAVAKKILFIASHRPGRAPNQRFRFEQYFNYFIKNGYNCELSHLIDKSDDEILYRHGHLLKKAWFLFGKSLIRRLKDLKRINNYDLIFVSREALMAPAIFFEQLYSRRKSRFIFDFDDSIWLTNVSAANSWFHWMKKPSKTSKIIALASHVIAGNQYLADYAKQWSDEVTIIPTTLDTEEFRPLEKKQKTKEYITVGWTGSITTIPHFEFIVPVLLRIKDKYGDRVRFEVVGDTGYYHAGLGIIGKAWSLESEKEIISEFDIGIMPLPDDNWTRGKCGFKGLLCMSLGVPVIMSPVGVNTDIIHDGDNGFLAGSEDEWYEKLCALIDNNELREKFSQNGRQTVVDKYSVAGWRKVYLDIFNKLTSDGLKK